MALWRIAQITTATAMRSVKTLLPAAIAIAFAI